ncbi:MAG: hypothetical protein KAI24_23890 [Planctomycetes bacterium]|nr:hypothetical protein [Planctomycetota bacterium]
MLACCGDEPTPARTDTTRPQAARDVDVAAIAVADLPTAVLAECHAPLRSRMQRVKATVTLKNDRRLLVQAHLPDRARVREGPVDWLVTDDAVIRMDGEPVSVGEATLLRRLLRIVDAAAFGPLHRAKSCARAADGFVLTDAAGDGHLMQLHERSLLPAAFTHDGTTVRITDYLHTPSSWVARVLHHDQLDPVRVVFEDGGVLFPADYFTAPDGDAPTTGPTIRTPIPGAQVETRSPTPIIVDGKATRLVMLADPGDWPSRHDVYRPVIEELQAQDQKIAGFPCIFVDDASRGLLAAPFRRRGDGPEFEPPDGYWLSDVPQGRLLVVYPPDGDVEARIARGRELLERALANRRLTAAGPITAQPFVHLHEQPPSPELLADVAVRVWVRIE